MEDIHKQTNWQTMVSMMTEAKMKKQKKKSKGVCRKCEMKFTRQLASSQKKKESPFRNISNVKISTLFEKLCFCVKMKKKTIYHFEAGLMEGINQQNNTNT